MDRINSRRRKLPALVAGICLFGALPASASIISLLEAEVDGQAGTDSFSNSDSGATGFVQAFGSAFEADVGNSNANAFGNDTGVFFVGAFAEGRASATSEFIHTWTITNTAAFAQTYTFDFFIYFGSISAGNDGLPGSDGSASYALDILLDGTSLYRSAASIDSDGNLTEEGVQLDGASLSGLQYSWNGTNVSLDLGLLGPGDTSILRYELVGTAFGDYDILAGDCFDGYGGEIPTDGGDVAPQVVIEVGSCFSEVRFGDPFSFGAQPLFPTTFTSTPAAVPEPGTLGLFGVGLASLLALRRRLRYS